MPEKSMELISVSFERMVLALDVVPNAALVMNQEGKIIALNKVALDLFGYKEDEILGKEIEALVPERFRGKHHHHRNGFFQNPGDRQMGAGRDLAGLKKNGSEFPIEIGLKPLKSDNGVVVMATIIDISERRRLEELVTRQQHDLMELSTPVIRLWEGIIVLPIVGTLDSERSRSMVEQLLRALSDSDSFVAIIDISGVPTVDTLVAQHLMKAIGAARLMGAECIISGIRPEIANTIINLGLDLSNVKTKSSMARALQDALTLLNLKIVPWQRVNGSANIINDLGEQH